MAEPFPIPAGTLQQSELGRVLLAGRLVATLRSKLTDQHITIQLKASAKHDRWQTVPYSEATHVFIDVPATSIDGGYNDKVGTLYPPHTLRSYRGQFLADRNADPTRIWAAKQVLLIACGLVPIETDQYEVLQSSFCWRCGKELTQPDSIERGMGPTCAQAVYRSAHQAKQRPASMPTAPEAETAPWLAPEPGADIVMTITAKGSLREAFGK